MTYESVPTQADLVKVIRSTTERKSMSTKTSIKRIALVAVFALGLGYVEFPTYQGAIAKALKPHGVTVHSLRKTYAYTLKSSNVHVTTASKLMGHSNPMVTLKIYTQVLDDEIDKSGDAIRDYLGL